MKNAKNYFDMNIGETIKTFRKKKGISQKELAEKSGMSANALCSIEKDKSFPSKETIKALCSSLEISPSHLLFASISEEDIPQNKREVFRVLQKPLLELLES